MKIVFYERTKFLNVKIRHKADGYQERKETGDRLSTLSITRQYQLQLDR